MWSASGDIEDSHLYNNCPPRKMQPFLRVTNIVFGCVRCIELRESCVQLCELRRMHLVVWVALSCVRVLLSCVSASTAFRLHCLAQSDTVTLRGRTEWKSKAWAQMPKRAPAGRQLWIWWKGHWHENQKSYFREWLVAIRVVYFPWQDLFQKSLENNLLWKYLMEIVCLNIW